MDENHSQQSLFEMHCPTELLKNPFLHRQAPRHVLVPFTIFAGQWYVLFRLSQVCGGQMGGHGSKNSFGFLHIPENCAYLVVVLSSMRKAWM